MFPAPGTQFVESDSKLVLIRCICNPIMWNIKARVGVVTERGKGDMPQPRHPRDTKLIRKLSPCDNGAPLYMYALVVEKHEYFMRCAATNPRRIYPQASQLKTETDRTCVLPSGLFNKLIKLIQGFITVRRKNVKNSVALTSANRTLCFSHGRLSRVFHRVSVWGRCCSVFSSSTMYWKVRHNLQTLKSKF